MTGPSRSRSYEPVKSMRVEVTHACPGEGEFLTLCCGRSPWDLPRSDRVTLVTAAVTCGPPADSIPDDWGVLWCPRCLYGVTIPLDLPDEYGDEWPILREEACAHECS